MDIEISPRQELQAVIEGPLDKYNTKDIFLTPRTSIRAHLDRLALALGGQNCPSGPITIKFIYAKSPLVWQPFDHTLTVNRVSEDPAKPTLVIFPAIYRATQHLKSLMVSPAECAQGVVRLKGKTPLPGILTIVLNPGWKNEAFFQGLFATEMDAGSQ